ncbi:hypothetical protein EV426DRAFT_273286 [Tirmania nivea]|nr:hypothetical protein EV426DRAFT_273286 [Tirmania nivea]
MMWRSSYCKHKILWIPSTNLTFFPVYAQYPMRYTQTPNWPTRISIDTVHPSIFFFSSAYFKRHQHGNKIKYINSGGQHRAHR